MGRRVEDDIAPAQPLGDGVRVEQVSANRLRPVLRHRSGGLLGPGESQGLDSPIAEVTQEMTTEKAGSSGDEGTLHPAPLTPSFPPGEIDAGMLLLLACAPALDCTVTASEHSTLVAELAVEAAGGTTRVRYEVDGHSEEAPAQTGAGRLDFELIGLAPDADVSWEAENDGATCAGTFHTGGIPDLPWVEVTVDETGQDDAGWVIGSFYEMGADEAWMAAYRRDGTLGWYLQGEDAHNALDFQWVDGLLFHNEFASDMVSDSSFVSVTTPGGAPVRVIDTPLGHHM